MPLKSAIDADTIRLVMGRIAAMLDRPDAGSEYENSKEGWFAKGRAEGILAVHRMVSALMRKEGVRPEVVSATPETSSRVFGTVDAVMEEIAKPENFGREFLLRVWLDGGDPVTCEIPHGIEPRYQGGIRLLISENGATPFETFVAEQGITRIAILWQDHDSDHD